MARCPGTGRGVISPDCVCQLALELQARDRDPGRAVCRNVLGVLDIFRCLEYESCASADAGRLEFWRAGGVSRADWMQAGPHNSIISRQQDSETEPGPPALRVRVALLPNLLKPARVPPTPCPQHGESAAMSWAGSHRQRIMQLYRHSLKTCLDWSGDRHQWYARVSGRRCPAPCRARRGPPLEAEPRTTVAHRRHALSGQSSRPTRPWCVAPTQIALVFDPVRPIPALRCRRAGRTSDDAPPPRAHPPQASREQAEQLLKNGENLLVEWKYPDPQIRGLLSRGPCPSSSPAAPPPFPACRGAGAALQRVPRGR
jgi:hypothetical protein